MILNYNIENCALRYALYVYLIYTIIIMIFRRLRDSNSSIFWIIGLFVPIINIYVLYLLYNKTSALYDKESNSIFYYALWYIKYGDMRLYVKDLSMAEQQSEIKTSWLSFYRNIIIRL